MEKMKIFYRELGSLEKDSTLQSSDKPLELKIHRADPCMCTAPAGPLLFTLCSACSGGSHGGNCNTSENPLPFWLELCNQGQRVKGSP